MKNKNIMPAKNKQNKINKEEQNNAEAEDLHTIPPLYNPNLRP